MGTFATIVSVASGLSALIGLAGVVISAGKRQGENEANMKELRKDVDTNKKDIDAVGMKVNNIQLENTRLVTALSSDLGWIKSSLQEIKSKMGA